ncbi:MAG: hypothetical protein RI947_1461 [Candidatus Parcubacteria bacterium]|jgi:hypothetical protein
MVEITGLEKNGQKLFYDNRQSTRNTRQKSRKSI